MSAATVRAIGLLHEVFSPEGANAPAADVATLRATLAAAKSNHQECLDSLSSHYFDRDRYGHYYPYYPARHAAFRRMERLEREIEFLDTPRGGR
jgi:hypothetical protein